MPNSVASLIKQGEQAIAIRDWHSAPWIGWALLAAALLSLLCALIPVLAHWRLRTRAWLENPQQLLSPLPNRTTGYWLSILMSLATAAFAAIVHTTVLRPLSLFISTLAVLSVAHITRIALLEYLGLLFIGATVVSLGTDWFALGGAGGLFGIAAAGLLLFWFSRFWSQQLLDGQAWTTTGRLVPKAVNLSHGFALCALLAAFWVGYAERLGYSVHHIGPLAGGFTAFLLTALGAVLIFSTRQAGGRVGLASGLASILAGLICAARTVSDARAD